MPRRKRPVRRAGRYNIDVVAVGDSAIAALNARLDLEPAEHAALARIAAVLTRLNDVQILRVLAGVTILHEFIQAGIEASTSSTSQQSDE